MDTYWAIILIVILSVIVIFGSLRQYKVKQILGQEIMEMSGGGRSGSGGHGSGSSGRGSGSSSRGSSPSGRGSSPSGRGRPDGGHGRPDGGHGRPDGGHSRPDGGHGRRYIGRPSSYYYGDAYDWGTSWWPYWSRWNYWWPTGPIDSAYNCADYASDRCVGSIDYQSCFNTEYRNCY